jgi:hypothetical protein
MFFLHGSTGTRTAIFDEHRKIQPQWKVRNRELVRDAAKCSALRAAAMDFIRQNNWDVKKSEYMDLVDRLLKQPTEPSAGAPAFPGERFRRIHILWRFARSFWRRAGTGDLQNDTIRPSQKNLGRKHR